MYSAQAHAVLQRILNHLDTPLDHTSLQPFYTRLGIHFPTIYNPSPELVWA